MATTPQYEKSQAISAKNNGIYGSDSPTTAYVIGNVGDPGLTTDFYCDIRSRYVLAVKDPNKRPLVKAGSDGSSIFLQNNLILVIRPKNLWIDCPTATNGTASPSMDLTKLTRVDQNNNINIGKAGSFTTNDITPINDPYKVGEQITITKLKDYVTPTDTPFQSFFPMVGLESSLPPYLYANTNYIGQTQAAALDANGALVGGGKDNTAFVNGQFYFLVTLPKTDYESFLAGFYAAKNYSVANTMPANMEYYFGTRKYITFYCASYIDLNTSMKQRIGSQACLPSIVSPPDSFITPKIRTASSFYYTQI